MTATWPRPALEALLAAVCAVVVAAVAWRVGPLVPVALIGGGLLVAAFAKSARLAVGVWLAVGLTIPYWLQVNVGPTNIAPQIAVGGAALVAFAPRIERTRWRYGDALFAGFIVSIAAVWWTYGISHGPFFHLALQASVGYLVGRVIVPAAGVEDCYRWLAFAGGALGAWALVETGLGWHPFTGLTGFPEGNWAALLERGGRVRAEAALGHPIVLGAVIASTVPFIVFVPKLSTMQRAALLTLAVAGVMATASRGPLIATGLAVVIALVGPGRRLISSRVRAALVAVALVAAIPAGSWLVNERDTETQQSGAYRGTLYALVTEDARPLGLADNRRRAPDGGYTWRQYRSVDSTPVSIAGTYGLIPAALFVFALLSAWWYAVRPAASPAMVAVAAQVPVVFTVAPITQLGAWWFFLAGLAVATSPGVGIRPERRALPTEPAPPSAASQARQGAVEVARSRDWPRRAPSPRGRACT